MRLLRQVINQLLLCFSGAVLLSATAQAQPYGSGLYGSSNYSNGLVQIGPIILPVTGPQLMAIVSAALIATSVGLIVWWRSRRKSPTSAS